MERNKAKHPTVRDRSERRARSGQEVKSEVSAV